MKKTLVLASTALLGLALSFGSLQAAPAKENVKAAPKTEKKIEAKTAKPATEVKEAKSTKTKESKHAKKAKHAKHAKKAPKATKEVK